MSAISEDLTLFKQSVDRKTDADTGIKLNDEIFWLKMFEKIQEKLGTLDCQICLEEGSIKELQAIPCGHSCCSACIQSMKKPECHICRKEFLKGQETSLFQINDFTLKDEIKEMSERLKQMKIFEMSIVERNVQLSTQSQSLTEKLNRTQASEGDLSKKNVELTKESLFLAERLKQAQMSNATLEKENAELTKKYNLLKKEQKAKRKLKKDEFQKLYEENLKLKAEIAKMDRQKQKDKNPEVIIHQFKQKILAASKPAAKPDDQYEAPDLYDEQDLKEDLYEEYGQFSERTHNKKNKSKSKKSWGGKAKNPEPLY